MSRPSFTRKIVNHPRLFLALVAVMGIGGLILKTLSGAAQETGAVQAGIFIALAIVAALYVGATHDDSEATGKAETKPDLDPEARGKPEPAAQTEGGAVSTPNAESAVESGSESESGSGSERESTSNAGSTLTEQGER